MSGKRLSWGILGCARIARRGLIPGVQGSKNSSLAAIASRDIATAQKWGAEFGIPRSYGSYEELIADPGVDVVYLPLPNELHRHWVMAAADAGKHVVCEKPLSLDVAEATEMVTYCEARGVLLMEAFMWRHQPRTIELLRRVRAGAVGELRLVRSSFSFVIDALDWRLDDSRGGGALWDVGCYGVNTARLFAGAEPDSVRSVAHFGNSGVDLSLSAELLFPGGVIGLVDCSFEQAFRCSYEIVGSEGVLEVPDAYLPPDRPTARLSRGGTAEILTFEGKNQYSAMVDAFSSAVDSGNLVQPPAENGLAQMTVLDAILKAARGS